MGKLTEAKLYDSDVKEAQRQLDRAGHPDYALEYRGAGASFPEPVEEAEPAEDEMEPYEEPVEASPVAPVPADPDDVTAQLLAGETPPAAEVQAQTPGE